MGPWGYGGVAVFCGVFPVTAAAGTAEGGKGLRHCAARARTKTKQVSVMIEHALDTERSLLHVRVTSALEKSDFEALARQVDPYIERSGNLDGLIIEAPATFPGWKSFGALASHLRFVRDHHKHISKIALVTDSEVGRVAADLVAHFVSAEIKRFPASQLETARRWISGDS